MVTILEPSTGAVPGSSTVIRALATDADSGIKEVRFRYQYCPESEGFVCRPGQTIGTQTSPATGDVYEQNWSFPSCSAAPDNQKFTVTAWAEDNCGNRQPASVDDLALNGRGCFRGATRDPGGRITHWLSELDLPGARGQVIIDGVQAMFPGPGTEAHPVSLSPGPHRFEAVLVEGQGQAGVWRFDLSQLGVIPGSLRVVAGDVVQIGPAEVAFGLSGHPGQRVVFTLQVGGR